MPNNEYVLSFVMAGGRGSRLGILTKDRSKSAVGILGHYRIFDFVATNIQNSNIPVMLVATQFEPGTLSLHIGTGEIWGFDGLNRTLELNFPHEEGRHFVTFQGTADSVRKSIDRIDRYNPGIVLILAADHIYVMDYRDAINWHIQNNADVTIMTNAVPESKISDLGIVKIDSSCRIIDFAEKPKDTEIIESFRLTPAMKSVLGINDPNLNFLASMGNYIFHWDKLKGCLQDNPDCHDFGNDIMPIIKNEKKSMFTYVFNGYWRDVGKIIDYFNCNMEFAGENPPIDLSKHQIRTYERNLSGAKIVGDTKLQNVILSGGNVINKGSSITNCVFGYQVIIDEQCNLDHCILTGASRSEFYDNQIRREFTTHIGKGSNLNYAILDKNLWIGENVDINPANGTIKQRKNKLESIGLKSYRELNNGMIEGDFFIEPKTGILIIGKQNMADPKEPILPDGIKI